ncbi:MAG: winged helix-turn-helix transcriptional regulator [Candidatus Baltobacteraceae bacterium]
MTNLRSYGDPCGLARALDIVGERWSLLIVRELLFGPKRFTDLRAGMPDASPNVLAQRLRELEGGGIIARRKLPPPAAAAVYELTERGRDLEPAVIALARWGSATPPLRGVELSIDSLMLALKTTFDPERARGFRSRINVHFGSDRFRATIRNGRIDIARGEHDDPDARIETTCSALRSVVFAGRKLPELRPGAIKIQGDESAVRRFVQLFPLRNLRTQHHAG